MSEEQGGELTLEDYAARTRFFNAALAHDRGRDSDPGWVYVVRLELDEQRHLFKIGLTTQKNPYHRLVGLLSQFNCTNEEMKIFALGKTDNALRAERILHKTFGDRHVDKEWFVLTEEDREWLLTTWDFARTQEQINALMELP